MTNEGAKYRLECECKQMDRECDCKKDGCDGCYIKMAIEALERQIPKDKIYKPSDDPFDYWQTQSWRCPSCGKIATFDNYCSFCGQKLQFPNSETEWGDGAKDD